MKKLSLIVPLLAILVLVGAGCNNVGARTEDSGFQKKMNGTVLETQLDDQVERANGQGADLYDWDTLDVNTVSSTNGQFTTLNAGTLYFNIGMGTTSLRINTTTAYGNDIFTVNGPSYLGNGTTTFGSYVNFLDGASLGAITVSSTIIGGGCTSSSPNFTGLDTTTGFCIGTGQMDIIYSGTSGIHLSSSGLEIQGFFAAYSNQDKFSFYETDVASTSAYIKASNSTASALTFAPMLTMKTNRTSNSYGNLIIGDTDSISTSGITEPILRFDCREANSRISTASGYRRCVDIGSYDTSWFIVDNQGKVGIGTTTPAYALSVVGDINASGTIRMNNIDYGQYFIGSAGTSGQLWSSDGTGAGTWLSVLPVANGGTGTTTFATGNLLFGNGTSEILTSSSLFWDNTNGRLGIGTTTPAYALDVVGTINADNIYQAGVPFQSSLWTTTNTVDMYYSSGNIGIGTDAPAYGLEVNTSTQFDKLYNVAGSLIFGDQTAAETIYVDATNGTDVAGCGLTDLTGACATITYGLTQVPKYLNVNYTVSIATGTYAGFSVSGFHGPGSLTIDGITASTTNHSVQVETSANTNLISVTNNSSIIYIKNLEVEQTGTQLGAGIWCQGPGSLDIDYVHLKNFTYGLYLRNGCNVDINEFNADDNDYGLFAKDSKILQRNGMSSTINDLYGLYAEASIIYTNGSQPTGATANEGTGVGGQILP